MNRLPQSFIVLLAAGALMLAAAGEQPIGAAQAPATPAAAAGSAGARPRLVVLISVDQFRADYLTRFEDLYLPARRGAQVGGLRWLMEQGAWELDAHHDHYPLFTGPGHSVLLTGAPPYKSGIVGNAWYDRKEKRELYCVEDRASAIVGVPAPSAANGGAGSASPKTPVSAANLRVTTVGDELKLATGGRAKVWGIGFKDRAAVLMAGHLADGVLWFDDDSAAWIGSRAWFRSGSLPAWVADWNARGMVDEWFGKSWTLSVPAAALARLWAPGGGDAANPYGLGASFPHRIDGGLDRPGRASHRAFMTTPFANGFVLDTARELVRREKLGADEVPDLLAINLSTNDYIGHAFGPDSPEVLDASVRTDGYLADFFAWLGASVPGGLERVTIVLTCDHGVGPNSAALAREGIRAGGYDEDAMRAAAETALDAALGAGDWTAAMVEGTLYLDHEALGRSKVEPARAGRIAAEAISGFAGVYAAYTADQLGTGAVPRTDIGDRLERSFHPERSGDVIIVPDPHWVPGEALKGATHGSPYAYDTTIPLFLAGAGIRPGRYAARSSSLDIAPTLSRLLGVLPPSGCEGRVLGEALKGVAK